MKMVQRIPVFAAWSLLLFTAAPAQAQEGDVQEIKQDLQDLKSEMRLMRSLLLEMQKSNAATSSADLASINKKLDAVIKDLAEVKKGAKPAPNRRQPDTTVYDVKIGNSPFKGPKDAPVTIVEFSDFQCPYCIREWPKLKKMMDLYPNQVKVVYKHYPLSFHKKAPPAQAASVLAQKQLGNEGFWKMHDLIVANAKKLDIPDLRKHAEALGMDLKAFDEVMADPKKIDALLADDIAEAKRCKVRGTPTVMINGLKLASRTEDGYKARIDEILKKKG